MSQSKRRKGAQKRVRVTIDANRTGSGMVSVQFGGVTVQTDPVQPSVLAQNVASGREALRRAARGIPKIGVHIARMPDVPLFRVDPHHPDRVIRQMGDKIESGVFMNGRFKVEP